MRCPVRIAVGTHAVLAPPGKCQDSISVRPRPPPSKPFPIHACIITEKCVGHKNVRFIDSSLQPSPKHLSRVTPDMRAETCVEAFVWRVPFNQKCSTLTDSCNTPRYTNLWKSVKTFLCGETDDRHGESDMHIFGAFHCDRSKGNLSYSLLGSGWHQPRAPHYNSGRSISFTTSAILQYIAFCPRYVLLTTADAKACSASLLTASEHH